MRYKFLLVLPIGVAVCASLPGHARAETVPPDICSPTMSSYLCYYGWDSGDCIVQNGQKYCRTVGFYYWTTNPGGPGAP